MKIGIPIAELIEGTYSKLAPSFNSCSCVGIYDLKSDRLEIIDTDVNKNTVFELLRSKDIKAVVSPSFKAMTSSIFADTQIAIYHAEGMELQNNIEKLKNNTLSKFSVWGI